MTDIEFLEILISNGKDVLKLVQKSANDNLANGVMTAAFIEKDINILSNFKNEYPLTYKILKDTYNG